MIYMKTVHRLMTLIDILNSKNKGDTLTFSDAATYCTMDKDEFKELITIFSMIQNYSPNIKISDDKIEIVKYSPFFTTISKNHQLLVKMFREKKFTIPSSVEIDDIKDFEDVIDTLIDQGYICKSPIGGYYLTKKGCFKAQGIIMSSITSMSESLIL